MRICRQTQVKEAQEMKKFDCGVVENGSQSRLKGRQGKPELRAQVIVAKNLQRRIFCLGWAKFVVVAEARPVINNEGLQSVKWYRATYVR